MTKTELIACINYAPQKASPAKREALEILSNWRFISFERFSDKHFLDTLKRVTLKYYAQGSPKMGAACFEMLEYLRKERLALQD